MQSLAFPAEFEFGTATASCQIEGGDRNNTWYRWAEAGKIKDGSHCIVADDHWNRVEEDIRLMQQLHTSVYRMSLEWSRIQPEPNRFDEQALRHYRWEVELLRKAGIRPLVTLHHFSNPLWFEDAGGWEQEHSPELFCAYCTRVVEALGDLVNEWVTINEPNVYLMFGYVFGQWPPGKTSLGAYFRCARNMIDAHIRAYRLIHRQEDRAGEPSTLVGIAHHLRCFDPATDSPMDRWLAGVYDRLSQEIFVRGTVEGRLVPPVGVGHPFGKGTFADFFGVNYYTRDRVRFVLNPGAFFGELLTTPDEPQNDLGWELYPEGLYRVCKRYYQRYRIPIFITENGTCDAHDMFRTRYIYDHLAQVHRLLDEEIVVSRYYHWTLMDNFEWLEGLSARFGLIHVDFQTQKRTIRDSGRFYAEVCEKKAVTDEMLRRYLANDA